MCELPFVSSNWLLADSLSVDSFRRLWESIQDVAVNHFAYLPEDTKPVG